MGFTTGLVIGMFIGVFLGVFVMGLMQAAKNSDHMAEELYKDLTDGGRHGA